MTYVYVASSWRNELQPSVVERIRAASLDCYDFRNPKPGDHGFSWVDIEGGNVDRSPKPKGSDLVSPHKYLEMISHPVAEEGFEADFNALKRADAVVLVLPCGKSAHLELGWAEGAGKATAILLEDEVEPELMYKMVDFITSDLDQLMAWLSSFGRPECDHEYVPAYAGSLCLRCGHRSRVDVSPLAT